jgi:hypothetical protein
MKARWAFVGWTLFVWAGRVVNVWRDDSLSTAGQLGRSALAASFVGLAVAALFRRRLVRVLALWTVAVWAVTSIGIVRHHHTAAFVVVHLVLAAVSVALAAWAWRSAEGDVERQRQAAAPTAGF